MTSLPLDLYPVLKSTDIDETRDLIWRHMGKYPIEPVGPAGEVDARINGRYIDQIAAAYMTFGAEMNANPGEVEYHYIFQVPLTGEYHANINGNEVSVQLGEGVAISPHQDVSTWWSANCGMLILRVPEAGLHEHLQQKFGVQVTDPLLFQPEIDLLRGSMRHVYVELVAPLLRSINTVGSPFDSLPVATGIEETLMTALLTSQPHTYSSRLNGNRGTASAWP